MSSRSRLSLRGRIAVAGIAVTGLGLGVAPLASAGPAVPDRAAGVPVIKIASTYQGVPYRWGGTSTRGFDCSGYVQFVFKKLGVKLPRTAEEQYEATRHLTRSQLQIGDLVFFGGRGWVYHVGIYAGNNMFWDAPHTGDRVRLQKIWAGAKVYGRVRGLPSAVVAVASPAPSQLPIVLAPIAAPATFEPVPVTAYAPPATPAASTASPATNGSPTATPASTASPAASTTSPAASTASPAGTPAAAPSNRP